MSIFNPSQPKRSLQMLLAANAVTAIMAISQGWLIEDIMVIYWIQSVMIGLATFVRILSFKRFQSKGLKIAGVERKPTFGVKVFIAFFFAFHYGFFHFVYAVFIFTRDVSIQILSLETLSIAALFFVSQVLSAIEINQNKKIPLIGKEMFKPYIRIIPMHLTIIFGFGMLSILPFDSNVLVISLFLLLKTFVDILSDKHLQAKYIRFTMTPIQEKTNI